MCYRRVLPETSIHDKPVEGKPARTITLEYARDPIYKTPILDKHSFKDADGNPTPPESCSLTESQNRSFRNKIIDTLKPGTQPQQDIQVLSSDNADQSVATEPPGWHMSREQGIRIKAGSPRSYYIGMNRQCLRYPANRRRRLCVVNLVSRKARRSNRRAGLALVVGEPTEFRFFSSTTRNQDQIGDRFDAANCDDITEMPPLQVTLPADEDQKHPTMVPVTLRADLTDIGTLQIWCDSKQDNNSGKLEFDIR